MISLRPVLLSMISILIVFQAGSDGLEAQDKAAESPTPTYFIPENNIDAPLAELMRLFFRRLTQGQVDTAFQALLYKSKIADNQDLVEKLVNQAQRALEIYGAIDRVEPINTEAITPSYLRMRFLALHADFPMRWELTFYHSPGKGWIVTQVKLDDRVESMFSDGW